MQDITGYVLYFVRRGKICCFIFAFPPDNEAIHSGEDTYTEVAKNYQSMVAMLHFLSIPDRCVLERCGSWMMCPLDDVSQYEASLIGVKGQRYVGLVRL